ncbi:MAG: hypothetical protein AAGG54_00545 [Pseudomonadota bacterium]
MRLLAILGAAFVATAAFSLPIETRLAQQRAKFDAEVPKNIIDLQLYRFEQQEALADGTPVSLISLNPNINSWFLLGLGADGRRSFFHLENPAPDTQGVSLESGADGPEIIITDGRRSLTCKPWEGQPSMLATAQAANLPFAPMCDGRLYLRVPTRGSYTSLEATSQFLRDKVWGGDAIVDFIKGTFNQDKYALDSDLDGTGDVASAAADGPPAARIRFGTPPAVASYHTIALDGAEAGMASGLWYPAKNQDGVFVSALQPATIAEDLQSVPGTSWLDGVESRAIAYFVAFEIDRFDLGFARGTDHPRLEWSPRPPYYVRPSGLPGPDGFSSATPIVSLGMASPYKADRLVAAFTAGFKRQHAAFRGGPLRDVNYGTHYGFMEHGVLYSKLWPGLSTVYVTQDGEIGMKTWEEGDYEMMPNLRFARQNGTPLIENGAPGPYVTQWLPGNWSGSANADLRTLRAGTCMIEDGDTRWMVYGYFSTATPSAMTKTFMAYGCDYAMLLDMNALEHTYLGLYSFDENGGLGVEHIMRGMNQMDKRGSAGVIPRFVGFPDNRDVFYLTRKGG